MTAPMLDLPQARFNTLFGQQNWSGPSTLQARPIAAPVNAHSARKCNVERTLRRREIPNRSRGAALGRKTIRRLPDASTDLPEANSRRKLRLAAARLDIILVVEILTDAQVTAAPTALLMHCCSTDVHISARRIMAMSAEVNL